jgi:hypothetical protein
MDYNKTKEKIESLTKELFDTYLEALKRVVKENGKPHPTFCETLCVDVSKYEIEYNDDTTTLDEVYYIPTKDEFGFIVWDEEMHTTVYIMREFKQRDIGIMTLLFYYLVECQ